jgi:hypothetical protein
MVISFLEDKENQVLDFFNKEKCLCALETDPVQNIVTIYSTDKSRLENCARLIQNDIQAQNFDSIANQIDEDVKIEFLNQMADMTNDFIWKCVNRKLILCGFSSRLREVYEKFIELYV